MSPCFNKFPTITYQLIQILFQCFYAVETALAYMVGNKAHGLANNSMTEEQRFQLSPDSLEYQTRFV